MDSLAYQDEPRVQWTLDELNNFLVWAVNDADASDVKVLPQNPLWIERHGEWQPVTNRDLTMEEVVNLLEDLPDSYQAAMDRLKGGEDLDFAHQIKVGRGERLRFRVNASAMPVGLETGACITLRSIPSEVPSMEDFEIEDTIYEKGFPKNGLVLVTGVMGSGKSTLIASMMRRIRENSPRSLVTYESPVEFDLTTISNPVGPCAQMRIPQDLDSFKKAPANAGRRAADVILLGEARDPETLDGMIQLAEIGVAAYSTVHTRSVADTPQRIINEFPADKQNQISTMLISSLRLVIQQRLVPRKGGGRVALREFLDFPQERRRELAGVKPQELNNHIQPMVEDDGQSIREAARMKYQQGLITEETYENVMSNRAAMEDLEDVA